MERRWQTVESDHLARGSTDVDVHTAWWDGPAAGPVFVCVHGLGGSHVNWALLAPRLAVHGQVWAPDLAGFGLTPPSGRRADVRDNRDLLAGFIRTVGGDRPVVLLGNSMGGLLTLLLTARHPELVAAAVLIAPATPRPVTAPLHRDVLLNFAAMAVPGVGEQVLALRQRRTTVEDQVRQTMVLCGAEYGALDPAAVAEHVEIARQRRALPYARRALLQAARSLLLVMGPRQAHVWRAVRGVRVPVLLLHGARDRLVTRAGMQAMARRRPDWTFLTYDHVGHIPMLEAPDQVADDIEAWLREHAEEQVSL